MKEKIRLEMKGKKILAHFVGKTWCILGSLENTITIQEAKKRLEADGYLVELKE